MLKCDGHSLIQFYPNFQARLRDSLRDLVGEEVEKKVDIGLAKDGSGVGGKCFEQSFWLAVPLNALIAVAALCALQATKQGH